jgi:tetratricopeptide (TPR) repeat protein
MIRPIATLAILALAGACSHHVDLRKPASQDNFGVQMAKMNLWREALFRFERAVQINPDDAMAHNNLAVAYEANGDFEKARKEYLEALKLDRTNQYIQKNYSRYVEFLSRNRKRQQKDTKTAAAAVPPSTTTAVPIVAAPPSAADASQPAPAPTPTPAPTSTQPPADQVTPPAKPPGGGR